MNMNNTNMNNTNMNNTNMNNTNMNNTNMNMDPQTLAAHETMEIHEMLNFKTVCALKSKLFQGMVQDKDLKQLLQKDVEQSTKAIQGLQALYARAPIQPVQ